MHITEEKLDQICKALGIVTDLQKAQELLQNQYNAIHAEFGAAPARGVRVGRWSGADSDKDSDDLKRQFLYWVRAISARRALPDTPAEIRAIIEAGTDAQGGVLVPEIFIPELLRVIEASAVMRGLVRVIPMTTDTSNLPSLVSNMTVYWPDELQIITQSDPVFGKVTLSVKTMAALTSASIQVAEDAALPLADLLVTLFGEALATEEDKQLLSASAAPFSGVLFASNVNVVTMASGKTTFSSMDFNDLLDVVDTLTTAASAGARFFAHRNIITNIRKIRDLNHQYIWNPSTVNGEPATIYGYPYSASDVMPANAATNVSKAFLAFGNPKYMFLGDRRDFRVEVSDHVGFKNNERFWKVTNRIAVAMGVPSALVRIRTAAS